MKSGLKCIVVVSAASLMLAGAAKSQTAYILNPITPSNGTVPEAGTDIVPLGINDNGVISGYERLYQFEPGTAGFPTAFAGTPTVVPGSPAMSNLSSGSFITADNTGDPANLPTSGNRGNGLGWGFGVNSSGVAAGSSSPGQYYATISGPGTTGPNNGMTILANGAGNGTLNGGGTGSYGSAGFGVSINDEGDVAGGAYSGANATHAFVYNAATATVTDLTVTPATPSGLVSVAYGINSTGTVAVGFSSPNGGSGLNQATTGKSATIWTQVTPPTAGTAGSPGTAQGGTPGVWSATLLPALPGGTQSIAFGMNTVNGATEVVGASDVGGGAPDATAWINGQPIDLNGAPSGTSFSLRAPLGVNWDNFYVTDPLDYFGTSSSQQALSSCADAINDQGEIVGYSTFGNNPAADPNGTKDAFLAVVNNGLPTIIDLNEYAPKGYHFTEATAINDQGDIVGYGTYTPAGAGVGTEIAWELAGVGISVPEPASLLLIAGAAGGLLMWRRSRQS